ncbi:MAG: response regulator [Deltaproteobacteria bacterium]|jgi:DNA-binding NtrC family response regulator|nr:response regulator [Deltaproteobacteria bacterium]
MEECQTLLIAEPGKDLATTLVPWLSEKGYTVKTVDSIKDVLMTVQGEKIHALVMDVCLPDNMGTEVISIIKSLRRDLPIIVTTDENNPQLESSIRQKGIFYYHVKSFGMDELMLAINNAMARSSR